MMKSLLGKSDAPMYTYAKIHTEMTLIVRSELQTALFKSGEPSYTSVVGAIIMDVDELEACPQSRHSYEGLQPNQRITYTDATRTATIKGIFVPLGFTGGTNIGKIAQLPILAKLNRITWSSFFKPWWWLDH